MRVGGAKRADLDDVVGRDGRVADVFGLRADHSGFGNFGTGVFGGAEGQRAAVTLRRAILPERAGILRRFRIRLVQLNLVPGVAGVTDL